MGSRPSGLEPPVTVPRVLSHSRNAARVWAQSSGSIESWLDDQAWLIRKSKTPSGTDDGTPQFTTAELGPYAARLSTPSTQESRQADRMNQQISHSLALACDEVPQEADKVRVRQDGGAEHVYRITVVESRRAPWGGNPVWHLGVVRDVEY